MSEETTVTAAPAEAVATEPNPIDEWFKTATPEQIMAHDRVRGIFGSRIQQERERMGRELNEESERKARAKAEADLVELAQYNPGEFAQRYLSEHEQKRIASDLENLKSSTRTEFAKNLGRGYSALPEWKELTPAEQETLAKAVVGKSDDNALIDFNAAALDVIAERRANAKLAKFRESDLAKERDAIRQEEAAKKLNSSTRPSLQRGTAAPTGHGWQDLPPGSDFNKEYEKNVLGRRR